MKTKRFIRKFHRWLGVFASLWILLLATTGLLLQHSDQWGLDEKFIKNSFILKSYGIGVQFIAFEQNGHQLTQIDGRLIEDSIVTIKLSYNINSAIYHQSNWIVTTNSQIHWLNASGQIIQSIDELDGLPLPVDNIGISNNSLFILSDRKVYDLNTLKMTNQSSDSIKWVQAISNSQLKEKSIQLTSSNYLSYEQLLFDLHAGITAPSIINDMAAIALIILSLSGIYLFFRKKNRTNHQANKK